MNYAPDDKVDGVAVVTDDDDSDASDGEALPTWVPLVARKAWARKRGGKAQTAPRVAEDVDLSFMGCPSVRARMIIPVGYRFARDRVQAIMDSVLAGVSIDGAAIVGTAAEKHKKKKKGKKLEPAPVRGMGEPAHTVSRGGRPYLVLEDERRVAAGARKSLPASPRRASRNDRRDPS